VRLFLDNSILPQAGRSSVKLSLIGNGTAPRIILQIYDRPISEPTQPFPFA
jgi:hypothetical protein